MFRIIYLVSYLFIHCFKCFKCFLKNTLRAGSVQPKQGLQYAELNKEIITSDLRSDTDEGPPSDIELFVAKNSMPDSNMVEDASEEAFLTEERSEFDGNNGTETERRKELVTWKCVHFFV